MQEAAQMLQELQTIAIYQRTSLGVFLVSQSLLALPFYSVFEANGHQPGPKLTGVGPAFQLTGTLRRVLASAKY